MPKNGPIIIIEDDADDQELLREVLKELQLPNVPRFFNSGNNALKYLLTTIERPFLIISDVNLPAMSGLELCQKLFENKSLKMKSIPFIFLTTTNDQHVVSQSFEMFVQGFFVKPASLHELKETIRVMVEYWKVCRHPHP